jgi:hypothetical protein
MLVTHKLGRSKIIGGFLNCRAVPTYQLCQGRLANGVI